MTRRKLIVAPNADVPQPPAMLPVIERLERIEQLLVRLIDAQPRIAYSARQAGLQLGDTSESFIRRLIRDGVITKVPHMGARVIVAHAELLRAAADLAPLFFVEREAS